jgi:hypothetical protein
MSKTLCEVFEEENETQCGEDHPKFSVRCNRPKGHGGKHKTESGSFLWETPAAVKPPLGLMPHKMWIEHRIGGIVDAMARYRAVNKAIPQEWEDELVMLCDWKSEL